MGLPQYHKFDHQFNHPTERKLIWNSSIIPETYLCAIITSPEYNIPPLFSSFIAIILQPFLYWLLFNYPLPSARCKQILY